MQSVCAGIVCSSVSYCLCCLVPPQFLCNVLYLVVHVLILFSTLVFQMKYFMCSVKYLHFVLYSCADVGIVP
jgi:hypothetical protein